MFVLRDFALRSWARGLVVLAIGNRCQTRSALEFRAAEKRHDVSISMNAGELGSSSPIVAYFSASLSVNSLVLCRWNE